jgi:endonuclease YncB( thermonuclease family)
MLARALLPLLLLVVFVGSGLGGDRKEWVKLADCRYVDAPDNDGDSFRVHGGDKEFTARLYYVDAPETNLRQGERTHDQSLHFGITLDETMKAGEKAKQRTKELLQKPFLIWTRWATAGGRGRESRYYVIVDVDGKSLGEILVTEGLARTNGGSAQFTQRRARETIHGTIGRPRKRRARKASRSVGNVGGPNAGANCDRVAMICCHSEPFDFAQDRLRRGMEQVGRATWTVTQQG